ncbi:cyclic AMP-responsive element-binding protein 3-like protein 4, partial [Cryptotermes secundus]|uniref:cyclic AMP-responsive element-binding protein 3-like protein 4 n=1 Tax=Cryptotermes secundus TaxID=105785 RepID=UPI001454CBF1
MIQYRSCGHLVFPISPSSQFRIVECTLQPTKTKRTKSTKSEEKYVEMMAGESQSSVLDLMEYFQNFEDKLDGVGLLSAASAGEAEEVPAPKHSKLHLTPEEKQLLEKEGITLSSHPLTQAEERKLKMIRRKIRNKIAAGDSRKRKKEYQNALEERVKHCTEENLHLVKRVEALQTENQTLAARVKELEAVLSHGAANTAQILSLNQSLSPNCDGQKDQDLSQPENKMAPLPGHSRNLLELSESR